MARLGVGGLVIAIGAAVGIVACFLPLRSVSFSAFGISQSSSGDKPINDWRGVLGLLCYLAAIVLVVLLAVGSRAATKGFCWGAIGVGAAALLFALLLLSFTTSSGTTHISGMVQLDVSGGSSPAAGTILNLVAAVVVAVGAVLKAREEKLF
jgi:hypothetical protein